MCFDNGSELSANYTIINWHRSSEDGSVVFKEVGYYSIHNKNGAKLSIEKTKILWNGHLTEVSKHRTYSSWFSWLLDYLFSLAFIN